MALTLCCGAAAAVLPQDGPGRQAGAAAHSAQPNPVLLLVNKSYSSTVYIVTLLSDLYVESGAAAHSAQQNPVLLLLVNKRLNETRES